MHNVENLLTLNCDSGRETAWTTDDARRSAPEISACVRQADEYFHAASLVGLPTKPLLLFYCAQTLAKASILASDSAIRLNDLNYHGLNTRPTTAIEPDRTKLRDYVNNPLCWSIENEFAISHAGIFAHLSRVCDDVEIKQGMVFRFKELARIIPDLSASFRRHYREPSHCLYLHSGPSVQNGTFEVYCSVETSDDITAVFPEFLTGFKSVKSHKYPGFSSNEITELQFAALELGTIAGKYLVRPHARGLHKSMPTLFACMFILSNIVRYKPAFWIEAIEGRSSGSVSIVEMLCNVFERRYPNDALELIWNERFTFGTPGYIS